MEAASFAASPWLGLQSSPLSLILPPARPRGGRGQGWLRHRPGHPRGTQLMPEGVRELGQAPVPPPQPRRGSPEQKTTGNRAAGRRSLPRGEREGRKEPGGGGVRVLSAPSPALQAPTAACAEGERLEGGELLSACPQMY